MKNEFQRIVDGGLSGLRWNERMSRTVLRMTEKEEKKMKRRIPAAMAIAMTILLAASLALAAGLLFTPRYEAEKLADEALHEKYGITDELMSFFSKRIAQEDGRTTVTYHAVAGLSDVMGEYVVVVEKNNASAAWSFDDAPESGWNADRLAQALETCRVTGGIEQVLREAEIEEKPIEPQTTPSAGELAERMEAGAAEAEEVKRAAKLTAEELTALARQAVQARFGLSDAQLAQMDWEEESSAWMMLDGRPCYSCYFWLWQGDEAWTTGDGIYIVNVDVQTGEVDRIYYDTGLVGNG